MKVFVSSDHHFFHKNIIKYEKRPFIDLYDMHKTMIKNHNNIVSKNDKVFFLGDVSFTNKEKTEKIILQLNGYKVLILGNHDNRSRKWYLDVGFNEVIKYPIIYDDFYILSHEPIHITPEMPYANIHGHTHSIKFDNYKYYNVCVENHNYSPININDIINKIKQDENKQ